MPKPQKIDLSAGLEPSQPPIDLSAGLNSVTPTTGASIGAAQPEGWLDQVHDDLLHGGNRTIVGRVLGHMEGNGDNGYKGLESGASPAAAQYMGSLPLGAVKMAKGAVDAVQGHPWQSVKDTVGGELQAGTIPLAMMGGPESEAAMARIPSASRAGEMLQQIRTEAANVPVSLEKTQPELARFAELTERGGRRSKPLMQLYKRTASEVDNGPSVFGPVPEETGAATTMAKQPDPLLFPEGRDFYSNIGDAAHQTPLQKLMGRGMKPTMRRQAVNVRRALNDDLTNAAASIGRGEDYTNAMREYANAMKLRKMIRTAGLLGAGEAARKTGLMGNWIHRTALTQ